LGGNRGARLTTTPQHSQRTKVEKATEGVAARHEVATTDAARAGGEGRLLAVGVGVLLVGGLRAGKAPFALLRDGDENVTVLPARARALSRSSVPRRWRG